MCDDEGNCWIECVPDEPGAPDECEACFMEAQERAEACFDAPNLDPDACREESEEAFAACEQLCGFDEPEPCACPDVWAPVCGEDGETYGNACAAECSNTPIAHEGECR